MDYAEVLETYQLTGQSVVDHYDTIGATVVLDLEYARLGLGASHNFGNQIRFVEGDEVKDGGYRIANLHLQALGKYPLRYWRDKLAVWPALGLRYSPSLRYEYRGSRNREANSTPHDLWAVAALGGDVAVSNPVELTLSLVGAYNLTPGMGSHADHPQGWRLGLDLGGLFRW